MNYELKVFDSDTYNLKFSATGDADQISNLVMFYYNINSEDEYEYYYEVVSDAMKQSHDSSVNIYSNECEFEISYVGEQNV